LQERGFAIEQADDDWRWSIAGIPERLCKFFSARRATLEEELATAGLTSAAAPGLAATINQKSRRAKLDLTTEDLTSRWREAAQSQGFRPDDVVAAARDAGSTATLEPEARCRRRQERIAAVPETLTQHDATFSRLAVIEAAANALVGTFASAEEAIEAVDRLAASEQIIPLAQTRDGPVYSTPQMLAAEKRLVELASRMARSHVVAPSRGVVENLLGEANFNQEQQAVIGAATAGMRLVHVQGAAGTGKSTTLGAIARSWQSAGYQVVGAAVAWRAANALNADLGIEARAIDSWLSRIERGQESFAGKTCLIVEEAGLQSTPQALRLLEAVDRSGGIVVSVGDENQLRPVGPGHAARLIREAIGAVELNMIVRQREAWARQAPMAFARGDARAALEAFAERDLLQMCDGPRATVEALANRWQELSDEFPDEAVLVTAKTNAEVRLVSAALRNRLRQRGLITGPDTAIEAVDASGNRHTLLVAVGDQIRFLTRNDTLGVINGTEARVVAVEAGTDEGIRISAEKDGQLFDFSPADVADAKGRARIASALAASTFAAQGMSVARHLALISGRFDRHDAYVAASRARESTEFFVDRRTLDRELEEAGPRAAGLQVDQARMAHLAARLSRTAVKTNALDLIAAQERARIRHRELAREF
jgi:ATP-dependent exoDNAse (exonuclease V) alpha subunit